MHLDELENAIDSLEVAAFLLDRSTNLKWKWITISLHHSLYSYMIAALTGGNSACVKDWGKWQDDGIILENQSGIWRSEILHHESHPNAYTIQWRKLQEKPKVECKVKQKEPKKIIGFWTALARVMDDHFFMRRYCIDRDCDLKLSKDQWQSIIFATEVRNSLVHFSPAVHAFDVESMKIACAELLEAIEFIAFLPLYIIYENRERGKDRVKSAIAKLREHCALRTPR